MGLDDLPAVVDLHQGVVGPDRDLLPDEGVRDRVEGVQRPDVEVPLDLHVAPVRDPVALRRRRQQQGPLPVREHHGGLLPGGAVDPQPGPDPAPVIGPPLRVVDVQELLPGEEAPLREFHAGLDASLVLGRPDPRRVHDDPARLRVLQPLPVPPGLQPVGLVHHRLQVVRN